MARSEQAAACATCGEWAARPVACSACGRPLRVIKDRSIAVVLAVFFSFVSWSYTYARNWLKFWIGASLSIVAFLGSFRSGAWGVLIGAVWLWAVIDNAVKPTEYYLAFPERIEPTRRAVF
jgi:hypothetical protein